MGVHAHHLYHEGDRSLTATQFVEQELRAASTRRQRKLTQQLQLDGSISDLASVAGSVDTFSVDSLPSTLNWCTSNNPTNISVCTAIKSQQSCGSCWAFAASDAIETIVAINNQSYPEALSPQQFLQCSTQAMTVTFQYCWATSEITGATWLKQQMKWSSDNDGCNGGMTHGAFDYAATHHLALLSELELPYEDADEDSSGSSTSTTSASASSSSLNGTCSNDTDIAAATITGWEQVVGPSCSNNETDQIVLLKTALQDQPISVAINSGGNFKNYKGGIYQCPNSGVFANSSLINHALLLVGYGTSNGTDYWILKNSYSSEWGAKGFMWLEMDSIINCGISIFPVIPIGASSGDAADTEVDGGGSTRALGLAFTTWMGLAGSISLITFVATFMGVRRVSRMRRIIRQQNSVHTTLNTVQTREARKHTWV